MLLFEGTNKFYIIFKGEVTVSLDMIMFLFEGTNEFYIKSSNTDVTTADEEDDQFVDAVEVLTI